MSSIQARTASELLDASLRAEGEDPITLELPVSEYVVDVPYKESTSPTGGTILPRTRAWTDSRRVRVSRTPCEILFRIFRKQFGKDWFELEMEVLLTFLHKIGMAIDEGGMNRVLALKILMEAPQDSHPFYSSLKSYQFLARALMGQEGQVDDGTIPSPKTLAVANYVAFQLRPGSFSKEVKYFIAAVCLHNGIWCLPHCLEIAQPELLEIAKTEDLGITEDRVSRVRYHIRMEKADDSHISDNPTSYSEQQALLSMDLEERVESAIRKADELNDSFQVT